MLLRRLGAGIRDAPTQTPRTPALGPASPYRCSVAFSDLGDTLRVVPGRRHLLLAAAPSLVPPAPHRRPFALSCVVDSVRMVQGRRDLVLAEARSIVAVDQQRHASAAIDVTRPAERLVERAKFLEQKLILVQRRDRFRAARADVNAIA